MEEIHDKGSKFLDEEFQELLHRYGIKDSPTKVKNPQAQAIVERIHLPMSDVLRMKVFEGDDWWFELDYALQSLAWVLRTSVPSTIPCAPGTLAFQHDMIMQTKIRVDWELIKKLRRQIMIRNNIQEKSKRLEHTCKVGNKELIVKLHEQR